MPSRDLHSYDYPDPTQAGPSVWAGGPLSTPEAGAEDIHRGPYPAPNNIDRSDYVHLDHSFPPSRNQRDFHISTPARSSSSEEGAVESSQDDRDDEGHYQQDGISDDSLVDEDFELSDPSANGESSEDQVVLFDDDSEASTDGEDPKHYALEAEVANLKQSFQRPEEDINSGLPKHRRGRKGPRGPRKAVKPSQEISILLGEANSAFIAGKYEDAEEIANQILIKNNEIYSAYMLVSEIQLARDDITASLITMITAAHLRPREPDLWRTIARRCLQQEGRTRSIWVNQAIYCLTHIIRINVKDFATRMERATLYRELGQTAKLSRDYEFMLKSKPYDLTLVRLFGEICLEREEYVKGINYYQAALEHLASSSPTSEVSEQFNWVDINIYVQLIARTAGYTEAVQQLKRLSRELLGRNEEIYWDDEQEDDREWDAENLPRRLEVSGFEPGRFELDSYGTGMPLELRVKLGIFRLQQGQQYCLEALNHFSWLDPEDDTPGAKLYEYADLFKEAADALAAAGYPHKALSFYEPIQLVDEYNNIAFYFGMASAYRSAELLEEAEQTYSAILTKDPSNFDARVQLAEVLEGSGRTEDALKYVNEAIDIRREIAQQQVLEDDLDLEDNQMEEDSFIPTSTVIRDKAKKQRRPYEPKPGDRRFGPRQHRFREPRDVRLLHMKLQSLQEKLRVGEDGVIEEWINTTKSMLTEFSVCKVFFPPERHVKFYGYTAEAKRRAWKNNKVDEVDILAGRLHAALDNPENDIADSVVVPTEFEGISFAAWFDLFLEYAAMVTRVGRVEEAYRVLRIALHANVFYHDKDLVFQLNACTLACALEARDESTICKTARIFMQSSHYMSEATRLYCALCRMCRSTTNWFNAGPSQKYVLRQIKAIDYILLDSKSRQANHFDERAKPRKRKSDATTTELDVSLIMLYGQMLYAGMSFTYALNYFFRARAIEPENPMINLCIGLAYIQHALKRQAENRHQIIMQGMSFLKIYYDLRSISSGVAERQEAEYNMARAYHLLGLCHLAEPYYRRVLELSTTREEGSMHGEYERIAAYNLRSMLVLAGDAKGGYAVSRQWLVL